METNERKENGLQSYLSPLAVWALAFGSAVGWGAFVMPANTFLPIAGPIGTVIGLLLGAVVMYLIGVNYAYMMNRIADCGGTYSYTKEAFGYDHAFLAAWFSILVYIAIIWANMTAIALIGRNMSGDTFTFGFHYTLAGFDVYFGEILVEIAVLVFCGAFCAFRKQIAAGIQTVCAVVLIGGIVISFFIIMSKCGGTVAQEPAYAPEKNPVLQVYNIIALAPWAFIGFENISHSTQEFKFPLKKSLHILFFAVLAGFIAYAAPSIVAANVRPARYANWFSYIASIERLSGIESMPVFYAVRTYMGQYGSLILTLVLVSAILTGLIGNMTALSRLMYALAKEEILPAWFAKESKDGVPKNTILFIVAISALVPFVGRSAIGWIVDVTTVGASVAYGYTSAAAYRRAKTDGEVKVQACGIFGVVMSVFFTMFLLVPNLWSVSALAAESYLILAVWGALGFVFFRVAFAKDEGRRLGKSTVVWVALLFMIFFTSLMWQRQAIHTKTRAVIDDIGTFFGNELADVGVERSKAQMEKEEVYLSGQMDTVNDALLSDSIVQMILITVGLAILFNVYTLMQGREKRLELEKLQAEENSRAKSTFLSNMSHDIRTPMNAIIGYINLAKEEDLDVDGMRTYMSKIESSSHHLLALINDVLEMSRIESGRMDLEEVNTDLVATMDSVRDMFATQMGEKHIEYTVTCENLAHRAVLCDKNRLNRVLLNLISNAYKFTPKKGKVTVTLTELEEEGEGKSHYRLSVKDSGIGMSEEFAAKVFEAFERERNSTVSGIQGTGLGTAITKSIVDLMGGTIDVVTSPGRGSEFIVDVAFKHGDDSIIGKQKKVLAKASDMAYFAGKRVLLAEDMDINREIASRLLKRMGFTVETALNGLEAVGMVKTNDPGYYDAVLMDIQMPVMDGYQATGAIRELDVAGRSDVPIIAMTANAFSEDVQKALDAGMNAHVAKPIDVKVLTATLEEILSGGRMRTQVRSSLPDEIG